MSKIRMDNFLRPVKDSIERFKAENVVNENFPPEFLKLPLRLWHEMQMAIEVAEKKLGREKVSELIGQFAEEAAANPHVVNHEYVISKLRDASSGCL